MTTNQTSLFNGVTCTPLTSELGASNTFFLCGYGGFLKRACCFGRGGGGSRLLLGYTVFPRYSKFWFIYSAYSEAPGLLAFFCVQAK